MSETMIVYKEDFYTLMHEVVQAWKEIRLVEIQTNHNGASSTPDVQVKFKHKQAPLGRTVPAKNGGTERDEEPEQKPRKTYTLTRDELEVRGMLARGMRPTDIMKAKFGADTYAPEKVRLRALSQVTTMIRHINRHQKWRKEQETEEKINS